MRGLRGIITLPFVIIGVAAMLVWFTIGFLWDCATTPTLKECRTDTKRFKAV